MATFPRTGFVKVSSVEAAEAHVRKSDAVASAAPTARTWAESPNGARGTRRRVSWSWWRRLALRSLGVSFAMQDALLDERRWTIIVTSHAVQQAGKRYRQGDPKHVASEVAAALCEGRVGYRAPGPRTRHVTDRGMLAWNADASHVYVMRRSQRGWIVITSLPTSGGLRDV